MKTDSYKINATTFAPILYPGNVADGIEFYKKAFNARELQRWSNPDGSIHVAEMIIEAALFHLHEEVSRDYEFSPKTLAGTTVVIGLFVANPDEVAAKAIAAGATERTPVKDYDYGYRQGDITDSFGHRWTIEKSI